MPGTVLGTGVFNEQLFCYKTDKAPLWSSHAGWEVGNEAAEVGRGQVVRTGRALTALLGVGFYHKAKRQALNGFKQGVSDMIILQCIPPADIRLLFLKQCSLCAQ